MSTLELVSKTDLRVNQAGTVWNVSGVVYNRPVSFNTTNTTLIYKYESGCKQAAKDLVCRLRNEYKSKNVRSCR